MMKLMTNLKSGKHICQKIPNLDTMKTENRILLETYM